MMAADDLMPVIVPSLRRTLWAMEEHLNRPLQREEVVGLQERAPAIALDRSMADALAGLRGYGDVAGDDVWDRWLLARQELTRRPPEIPLVEALIADVTAIKNMAESERIVEPRVLENQLILLTTQSQEFLISLGLLQLKH